VWTSPPPERLRIKLRLDDIAAPKLMPSWNIAPAQDVLLVLRDRSTGVRRSEKVRLGLIPSWAKDSKIAFTTFNARCETIDIAPAFRGAWRAAQRCLVVSDGFYEWRKRNALETSHVLYISDHLVPNNRLSTPLAASAPRPGRADSAVALARTRAGVWPLIGKGRIERVASQCRQVTATNCHPLGRFPSR
jgi:hypothetical protein